MPPGPDGRPDDGGVKGPGDGHLLRERNDPRPAEVRVPADLLETDPEARVPLDRHPEAPARRSTSVAR